MPSTAVISILCRDRIGLVATISETVVDMGGKVSDMIASVLGKGIVCVVINLWPDKEPPVSEIRKRINDLPGLNAANVQMNTFDLLSFSFDSIEKTSHRIRCRRLNDNRGDWGLFAGRLPISRPIWSVFMPSDTGPERIGNLPSTWRWISQKKRPKTALRP